MSNILILDDEKMITTLVSGVLKNVGHNVVTSNDPKEALELIQTHQDQRSPFELIITDLNMPEMSGFVFMDHLRAKQIPIMVFTGHATKEMVVRSARMGAVDFLNKGKFDEKKFIARVAKLLNQYGAKIKKSAPVKNISSDSSPPPTAVRTEETPTQEISERNVTRKTDRLRDIEALSFVATEVMKITSDRSSHAKELVECITKDQSLTSKVLKMASSAFYQGKKKARNLEDAVLNIGFTGIQEMAVAVSIVDQFKDGDDKGLDRVDLWRHSIMTSIICKRIALAVGYESPETAFLAGLLHDIGRIMFDDVFHEEYVEILSELKNNDELISEAERKVIGMDHAELAGKVLLNWSFPEKIRDAITFQNHELEKILNLKSKDRPLIGICKVGNAIAELMNVSQLGFEEFKDLDPRIFDFIDSQEKLSAEALFEDLDNEYKSVESILLMNCPSGVKFKKFEGLEKEKKKINLIAGHPLLNAALAKRWEKNFEISILNSVDFRNVDMAILQLDSVEQAKDLMAKIKNNPPSYPPLILLREEIFEKIEVNKQEMFYQVLKVPTRISVIDASIGIN